MVRGLTNRAVQSPTSSRPASTGDGSLQSLQLSPRGNPDADDGAGPGSQRLERPRHQHLLGGLDADGSAAVALHLVRGLSPAQVFGPDLPGDPRFGRADAERGVEVFEADSCDDADSQGVLLDAGQPVQWQAPSA
jgi:hypothetical protein